MTLERSRPGRFFLVSLLLAGAAVPAVAAPPLAPSLHIVRVGHAELAAFQQNIQTQVLACQGALGLPLRPATLPSDQFLSTLAVQEQEEFFDGPRWAQYSTQRTVAADSQDGCKLKVFVHRHARVAQACQGELRARAPSLGDLSAAEGAKPHRWEIAGEIHGQARPRCKLHDVPEDVAGLPVVDAGSGHRCVWHRQWMARSLAKAGLPPVAEDPQTPDICVHPRFPVYPFNDHAGRRRLVVLKHQHGLNTLSGGVLSDLVGETAGAVLRLKSLQEGSPIPAQRFSRGGIEAFMDQPHKLAVGR